MLGDWILSPTFSIRFWSCGHIRFTHRVHLAPRSRGTTTLGDARGPRWLFHLVPEVDLRQAGGRCDSHRNVLFSTCPKWGRIYLGALPISSRKRHRILREARKQAQRPRLKSDDVCPICQDELNGDVAQFPCGHRCCALELDKLLHTRTDCPLCRTSSLRYLTSRRRRSSRTKGGR